jgi:hypothetical protein
LKTEKAEAIEPEPAPAPPPIFSESAKLCAYGRFGSRKTLQIKTLIEAFGADKVAIVSAESGLNTIKSVVLEKNVIRCASLGDLRDAWARCSKEFNTPDHWICMDGWSQIAEWIENEQFIGADRYYEELCKGTPHEQMPIALRVFGKFITNKDEIDNQKIYGKIGLEIQNVISAWIRLRSNLYANFLEKMTGSNGREATIPWGPDVPGRVGVKKVCSSFDYLFRMYYSDGKLVAGMDPGSNLYLAKTREDRSIGGAVPKEVIDFDLAQFVKKYIGVGRK